MAYCYRFSVVCMSVCLSVCLLDTITSCAKTAEPIDMPFAVRTRVGPELGLSIRWDQELPGERAILGDISWPSVEYKEYPA